MNVASQSDTPTADPVVVSGSSEQPAPEREPSRMAPLAIPRGDSVRAWMRTGTGVFTSAVTLLAATLTVVFLLVPSLKPAAPPAEFGATLSDARIETGVGLGNYYQRIGQQPPSTVSRAALGSTGVVVSFTVAIQGYNGKTCDVVWSVLESGSNKRVTWNWLVAQPGWPAKQFIPAGNKDQGNGEIFVQDPPTPGRYLVRIELNDPNGTRLATIDSPIFTVTGSASAPPALALPTMPNS